MDIIENSGLFEPVHAKIRAAIRRAMQAVLCAGPAHHHLWDEHQARFEAILAGDSARAAELSGRHLRNAAEKRPGRRAERRKKPVRDARGDPKPAEPLPSGVTHSRTSLGDTK